MIFNILIGVMLVLFAAIGLGVGLYKGYTSVRPWAVEYLLSAFLTICLGAILNKCNVEPVAAGSVMIAFAVVFMLIGRGLAELATQLIKHELIKRDNDMLPYGKLGVVNRVIGGLVLLIKGVTIALIIILPLLLVIDLAHFSVLDSLFGSVLNGFFWHMFKPILFDLIVIGAINIAIRHGFSKGIASSLWSFLVFLAIVGAGFIAYHLVFGTDVFAGPAEAFSHDVASWFGNDSPLPDSLPLTLSKVIITFGLFVLASIIIFVVSFFVSRVISFARLGTAFYIADGILGAIVMFFICVLLMLFIGYIIQPLYGLDFMEKLDSYFKSSTIAKYFYNDNILVRAGVPVLQIREWLT